MTTSPVLVDPSIIALSPAPAASSVTSAASATTAVRRRGQEGKLVCNACRLFFNSNCTTSPALELCLPPPRHSGSASPSPPQSQPAFSATYPSPVLFVNDFVGDDRQDKDRLSRASLGSKVQSFSTPALQQRCPRRRPRRSSLREIRHARTQFLRITDTIGFNRPLKKVPGTEWVE